MTENAHRYFTRPDRPTCVKGGLVSLIGAAVALAAIVTPSEPIMKALGWAGAVLFGGVSLLALIEAAVPSVFETIVETTDKSIVAKYPLRSALVIPWERVSRIEFIPTFGGPFGDDVSVRIHWDGRKITFVQDVAFDAGIIAKIEALTGSQRFIASAMGTARPITVYDRSSSRYPTAFPG